MGTSNADPHSLIDAINRSTPGGNGPKVDVPVMLLRSDGQFASATGANALITLDTDASVGDDSQVVWQWNRTTGDDITSFGVGTLVRFMVPGDYNDSDHSLKLRLLVRQVITGSATAAKLKVEAVSEVGVGDTAFNEVADASLPDVFDFTQDGPWEIAEFDLSDIVTPTAGKSVVTVRLTVSAADVSETDLFCAAAWFRYRSNVALSDRSAR